MFKARSNRSPLHIGRGIEQELINTKSKLINIVFLSVLIVLIAHFYFGGINLNPNNNNRNQKDVEPLNKAIRAREVLIIHEDGTKQGPINKFEALKQAEESGVDMLQVGIQPNGVAIVKFLDYGKYKYEQKRKQKDLKKNQVRTENREIRLTVGIGDHDLDVKAKKAREFLNDGDRVKVSLKFKGREIAYQEFGMNTINKFFDKVKDVAKVEKEPKLTNRFLDMYIVPSKIKSGGKNNAKNENEKIVS